MTAENDIYKYKSELIFKFSFGNPLFIEHELILNWSLSKSVLVTSYDLLKDEQLILRLQKNGSTLKEHLRSIGFNKKVKIICDTGIFEYEAKKAKLKFDIPNYDPFTLNDIFNAYSLIDPDFLVAPDEIILQSDSIEKVNEKTVVIIKNLIKTLDLFPKEKVIPVLQGFNEETMINIIDFVNSEKLNKMARGGLIPLWKESKGKFEEVIKLSEKLTRENGIKFIHSFGLPSLKTIRYYFYENSYNSLDTSVIYYRTAQRKFLINRGYFISVRFAHFDRCGCSGCLLMSRKKYSTNSSDFVIGLYYHNCFMLNRLTGKLQKEPNIFEKQKSQVNMKRKFFSNTFQLDSTECEKNISFISAKNLLLNKTSMNTVFLKKEGQLDNFVPLKILIISSCSKKKSITVKNVLSLHDLRTKEQREKILSSNYEKLEAKKLYSSERVKLLNSIVDELRKLCELVDVYFLSAGFGLVNETMELPNYDVKFTNKSKDEVVGLSKDLEIQNTILTLPMGYDLIYLDLSECYLQALSPLCNLKVKTKEIVFFGSNRISNESEIQLNELEIIQFDMKANYFPYTVNSNTKLALLKNFVIYLKNHELLGNSLSFKDWITNVLDNNAEIKTILRVF
jgi:hypothetical protein